VSAADQHAAGAPRAAPGAFSERGGLRGRFGPQHAALAGILALSAFFNVYRLSQNGYANTFYSAGVKSMLVSLHNFLFVSFDPGGLATIDKPPLAMWVQAVSAKLFGFSPLSLLLPEAIISVIAVAALYKILVSRVGVAAALGGALVLALFPSFVAVSRDNGVDPLLILLMIHACGAGLKAVETGRLRTLVWCGVLIGLAFNVKTLAAYLVVPGIAFAYLLCAPGSLTMRLRKLLVAGMALLVVSFAWIAMVELTPASQRPFVGSSTDNTEWGLTFEYNGFGRVEGEVGGPGNIPEAEGGVFKGSSSRRPGSSGPGGAPRAPGRPGSSGAHGAPGRPGSSGPGGAPHASGQQAPPPSLPAKKAGRLPRVLPNGRERNAIAFGGSTGPLRLFDHQLSDQGSWLLPFALLGLLAVALSISTAGARWRERLADRRTTVLFVFGGWLLVEFVLLSFSKGIVHPYYISALAPGVSAMTGAGLVAFATLGRRRDWRMAILLALTATATVAAQLSVLGEQRYMRWFAPILIVGTVLACCLIGAGALRARPRLATPGAALLLGLLLIAPGAYAATTWLAPVDGTFAAAGPHQAISEGKYGINAKLTRLDHHLLDYVESHRPGTRWSVLVDASTTAAPLILYGSNAGALGGYSGSDPVLDGPGLGRPVGRGEARYVLIGGPYASRGGNLATKAVLRACRQVPYRAWHGSPPSIHTLVLFDCAGDARALAGGNRA
jgi:4-amino-4-deoxy-L-arabinose transferase-like glycosyltransferase